MLRVRFAPSPTGFLHVGSARTFIFNWLYARHNGGTMVLRLDDTDVERNTDASVNSIFEGLRWLDLGWDEEYKQSERLNLHREVAWAIFEKGRAYRDFTPAHAGEGETSGAQGTWRFNPGMRELSRDESDRRAAAGEPFALRFRVPREGDSHAVWGDAASGIRNMPAFGTTESPSVQLGDDGWKVSFRDAVYGEQGRLTADIEDFALLRSDGMPTYHLASCADDAQLGITHVIRGQDHLSNTFKHVLILEVSLGAPPQFAHLPLLLAPDGSKLSKRRHGPVVSVTTYRDAGFLPEAFINFLCLLGWSPKDDREKMTLQELTDAFSLEGINLSNTVVNFKEPAELYREKNPALTPIVSGGTHLPPVRVGLDEMFDPKALWLNAEHIRSMRVEALSSQLLPFVADLNVTPERMLQITPLIRERIRLLSDVRKAADFFFVDQLPPYDPAELIPQKGDAAMALKVLTRAREVLAQTEFKHDPLDQALRAAAQAMGVKTGQMFQPIRVAVCGRKNAPPLFETLAVLGRDTTLRRIDEGILLFMDDSEKLAKGYLCHLGFDDIVYEPDGNVPPDFLVDGKIAVEVRRLNQNGLTDSGPRGLEETEIPFRMKLRRLLMALGPSRSGVSWFVHYSFRRPLPEPRELFSSLRQFLREFQDNEPGQTPCRTVLNDGVEIELCRAGDTYPTFFLLGGGVDEDSGGWVLGETVRNLRICIDEKTSKVRPFRHKYSQWWLILIDRIGYGVDECDRDLFSQHLKVQHDWDKVLLLNPLNTQDAFEVRSSDR